MTTFTHKVVEVNSKNPHSFHINEQLATYEANNANSRAITLGIKARYEVQPI